jgi:paraquat-inducible protein B
MAVERHLFKVGIFVVALTTLAIAFVFWIGATGLGDGETVHVAMYFDESVQGLSEGSEVKYRGWKIGEVAAIGVADDDQHLLVECLLVMDFVDRFCRGETAVPNAPPEPGAEPPPPGPPVATRIIAQLTSSGLTGLKFIEVDIDPRAAQRVGRGIPDRVRVPDHVAFVISTRSSTLVNVERALADAIESAKEHGGDLTGIVRELNGFLASLNDSEFVAKATNAITDLDHRIDELDTKGLSAAAQQALERVGSAVDDASGALAALSAEEGDLISTVRAIRAATQTIEREVLAARLPATTTAVRDGADRLGRASDSVNVAANGVSRAIVDLDVTLTSIRLAVDELRGLVAVLRQDPSALLYGRTYPQPPHSAGKP